MNPDPRRNRRAALRPTARPRPCASCAGAGCVTFDTGDVVACPRCPSAPAHLPTRTGARAVPTADARGPLGVLLERVLVVLILLVSAATSVGAIAFLCEAIARWA